MRHSGIIYRLAPARSATPTFPPALPRLLAVGALVAGWYAVGLPSGYGRALAADLIFTLLSAFAAVLCLRAGRRLGPDGRPWRFVGLGCAAWCAGMLAWDYDELIRRVAVPYPSLADAGYLLFYPLCSVGLVFAVRRWGEDGPPSWEVLLDGMLVLVAAAAVAYRLLLAPVLADPGPVGADLIVSLLWQAGTVALLFLSAVALVWRADRLGRGPLLVLLLGIASFSVANLAYGRLALQGTYRVGDPVDLGWHAGFLLVAAAALLAGRAPSPAATAPAPPPAAPRLWPRTAATVVSVLTAAGLAAAAAARPEADRPVAAAVVAIGLLVSARLGLAALHAHRLHQRAREHDRLAAEAAAAEALVRRADELALSNEALRAAEAKYRTLVEQLPAIVYVGTLDDCSAPLYVSPRVEDLLGFPAEAWIADPGLWARQLHPDDRERALAAAARSNATGQPFRCEYRRLARDGRVVWVRDEAVLVRDETGRPRLWQGVNLDVTAQKEAEAALVAEQAFNASVIASSADGVHAFDRDCRFTAWNPRMEQTTGVPKERVLGRRAFEIFPFLLETGEDRCFAAALAGETTTMAPQANHIPETGRDGYYEARYAPLRDPAGEVIGGLCVVRDVTERTELEARLAHQAYHDPLTGLPNRALFLDRLGQGLARAARQRTTLALLFLDLDDFKVVNDSLGHAAGDRLLVAVGQRLRIGMRAGDTLARLGGDEFTLLLEDVAGEDDAKRVAERLAEELRPPFDLDGHRVFVTPSVGIAVAEAGDEADDLLRRADVAMYQAKQQGRARYAIFDAGMDAQVWQRVRVEGELRRALEVGELRLHYQPLVELTTGQVVEVEALARWEHPERGLVPPAEFIPLAEETGLIVPLGRWVLAEACRQVSAWRAAGDCGPDLRLSVNLSARQLRDPGLTADVARALLETGLPPERLQLEVTESAAMDDDAETVATLEALRRLGVRLAVDDFGTGYSAFSYLRRCPVDTLKIDRTYVAGLGADPEDETIVRAVVAFAQTMGLGLVAEGIETAEQARALRDLGCELGQGFHFACPLPPGAVPSLLNSPAPEQQSAAAVTAAAAD